MIKSLTLSVAALALCLTVGTASAQTSVQWPTTPRDAKAFVQKMPGDAWEKTTAASLNLKFLVGKPMVAVFNPYDEEIDSIVCDGKWALVGLNAYDKAKGAPASIAPHSVVIIPTDGFDGYCTKSIKALTESGASHDGELQIPGDFSNSTAIFFKADKD